MAETRITVDQAGRPTEGVVVDIDESTERFSELKLSDGTILKIKMSAIEVVRINDQWDRDGNPVYHVKSHNLVAVSKVPDELKRQGG